MAARKRDNGFELTLEERDGWLWLGATKPGRFIDIYEKARFRREGELVRSRTETGLQHANLFGNINGGFILAYVDLVISIAPLVKISGKWPRMVTMSASTNFLAPAHPGVPLDAVTEIVAETGSTMWLRGFVEQEGRRVSSFEGVMRKVRDSTEKA